MRLQPVDDFVLKGFHERFYQQFGCPAAYISSEADRKQVVQRLFNPRPVTLPYATLLMQTMSDTTESFSSHSLATRGILAAVDQDGTGAQNVRVIPQLFEVEVKYYASAFRDQNDQKSVWEFARRWKFAARNGSMSFKITYGSLVLNIQVRLSESISFPTRDNFTQSETSEYEAITTATIHGFISEPELKQTGIVNEVAVLESLGFGPEHFVSFNQEINNGQDQKP